ncbi:MAG: hypothetical protein Q8O64_12990 [Sideroxyarcus sp.]|nr:hypothetical protein [Sideroxyarcus sp.]
MDERWQFDSVMRHQAASLQIFQFFILVLTHLRRAPHPAPDTVTGALLQQNVVAMHEQQEGGVPFWHNFPGVTCGKFGGAPALQRDAVGLHRASCAFWAAADADRGTHVHQGLGIDSYALLR